MSSSLSGKLQNAILNWSCSGMGWGNISTSSNGMLHATACAASSTNERQGPSPPAVWIN